MSGPAFGRQRRHARHPAPARPGRPDRRWLDGREIAYVFHDYRKDGLDRDLLQSLELALGWNALLNRRGTTWRKLPQSVRDEIDRESALEVMLENPAVIKRPILARGASLHLGFSENQYQEIFD